MDISALFNFLLKTTIAILSLLTAVEVLRCTMLASKCRLSWRYDVQDETSITPTVVWIRPPVWVVYHHRWPKGVPSVHSVHANIPKLWTCVVSFPGSSTAIQLHDGRRVGTRLWIWVYLCSITKMYWLKFLVYDHHILLEKHLFFKSHSNSSACMGMRLIFYHIAFIT